MKDGAASVKLEVPLIAENGAVVPVSVSVDSPMTPTNYVKHIYVVADKNRIPVVTRVTLAPEAGRAFMGANIRLGESGDVRAIVEQSDGTSAASSSARSKSPSAAAEAESMSDIGKVRLRIPSPIKPGDVVQVRSLVIHPMERIERDAQGKIIQKNYNYINKVTVTYLGKTVAVFDTTQSVAENPFFSFTFKATDPGQLKVEFLDTTGGRYEGTADIKFS